MSKTEKLNKDQVSLLLYLECRATDHGGRVSSPQMNAGDFQQAAAWSAEGFIEFGRIAWECADDRAGNYFVRMSDESWSMAHELRRERAERMWASRDFITTTEKRQEAAQCD